MPHIVARHDDMILRSTALYLIEQRREARTNILLATAVRAVFASPPEDRLERRPHAGRCPTKTILTRPSRLLTSKTRADKAAHNEPSLTLTHINSNSSNGPLPVAVGGALPRAGSFFVEHAACRLRAIDGKTSYLLLAGCAVQRLCSQRHFAFVLERHKKA